MRGWRTRVVPLLVCAPLAACGPGAGAADAHDEAMEAIVSAFEGWEAAAEREDAGALAATYTEDAVFLPPGREPVHGRSAIQELLARQFDAADITADFTTDEIVVSGDWAFRRGSYVATGTVQGTGDTLTSRDKFIEIWRRGADGRWRIARDIWNGSPSMPASPEPEAR